jgi:biotin operon repressor
MVCGVRVPQPLAKKNRLYMFPVPDRLLAHRPGMGSSIWEYLWLVAHVTSDQDGDLGVVEHGKPVSTGRIATDLNRSREAVLANLEKLEAGNYVDRSAAVGHAYSYRVRIRLPERS